MSSAKLAIACGFVAVVLSACGTTANPEAGTISPTATTAGHAKLDDQRNRYVLCLLQSRIAATKVGQEWVQLNVPGNPKIQFVSTPGAAQWEQIDGQAASAEVIGSALLYPEQASDTVLGPIEMCLGQGVKG